MSKSTQSSNIGFKLNFEPDYYKILGVGKSYSHQDIVLRFRQLKAEKGNNITENMIIAYNVLVNDTTRNLYNEHKGITTKFEGHEPTIITQNPQSINQVTEERPNADAQTSSLSTIALSETDELSKYKEFIKNRGLSDYDVLLVSPEGKPHEELDKEIKSNYKILINKFKNDESMCSSIYKAYLSIQTQEKRNGYTLPDNPLSENLETTKSELVASITAIRTMNNKRESKKQSAEEKVKKLRSYISKMKLWISGKKFSDNEEIAISRLIQDSSEINQNATINVLKDVRKKGEKSGR